MNTDIIGNFIKKHNHTQNKSKPKKFSSVFQLKKGQKDKKILLPPKSINETMNHRKETAFSKFTKKYIDINR